MSLAGAIPQAARASETRHYRVVFRGHQIGTSLLSVRTDPGGLTTYVHESHLSATRDGKTVWTTLHEEVRLRDGVFRSAWAVKETGDTRHVVRAHWDPSAGVVWVSKDGNETAVPAGDPAGLETLFDAPRRLVRSGAVGAKRRVFDMPEGKVGWVVLRKTRNAGGWAETEELGIHVRTRWADGAKLPDVLSLPDLGLVYTTTQVATGAGAAQPEDLTGGGVKVVGRLSASLQGAAPAPGGLARAGLPGPPGAAHRQRRPLPGPGRRRRHRLAPLPRRAPGPGDGPGPAHPGHGDGPGPGPRPAGPGPAPGAPRGRRPVAGGSRRRP